MYWLGNIIGFIGVIWIAVNAFRKDGPLWGILCFLCGFVTIYYAIKNFAENKIPLIMLIVGIAMAVATMPSGMMATGLPAQ